MANELDDYLMNTLAPNKVTTENEPLPTSNPGDVNLMNAIMGDLMGGKQQGGVLAPLINAKKMDVVQGIQKKEQEVQQKRAQFKNNLFKEILDFKNATDPKGVALHNDDEVQMKIESAILKAEQNGLEEAVKPLTTLSTMLQKDKEFKAKQMVKDRQFASDNMDEAEALKMLKANGVPIGALTSLTIDYNGKKYVDRKDIFDLVTKNWLDQQRASGKIAADKLDIVKSKLSSVIQKDKEISAARKDGKLTFDTGKNYVEQLVQLGDDPYTAFGKVFPGINKWGALGFGGGGYTFDEVFPAGSPEFINMDVTARNADNAYFREAVSDYIKSNAGKFGGLESWTVLYNQNRKIGTTPNVPKVAGQANAAPVAPQKIGDGEYAIGQVIENGKYKIVGYNEKTKKWQRQEIK